MAFHSIRLASLAMALALSTAACATDNDSNPPGPRGGPGTNWENPPGRAGGPGASPDTAWRRTYAGGTVWVWHPRKACWYRDKDQNPPGARGGPGTNWENPPGPIGGRGASPDRRACR